MKISVKVDEKTFEVEIADLTSRPVIAMIDGQSYEVWPADSRSEAVPPTGPAPKPVAIPATPSPVKQSSTTNSSAKTVCAPLPGVIVAVAVQPGAVVTPGQELCTLEAMKMKNVIYASRAGTIAAVKVAVGQSVKHRDVLLEYSE